MKKFFFIISLFTIIFIFTNSNAHSQILTEQFDYNVRQWPIEDNEYIKTYIEDGIYVFEHKKDEAGWFIFYPVKIDTSRDYTIETILMHIDGRNDYGYGLVWDMVDDYTYYAFDITDNGYYRISKNIHDNWTNLTEWTFCDKIYTENASNTLLIRKHGDEYYFVINNNIIDMHTLPFLGGSNVGFMVYRNQKIGIDKLDIDYVDPELNVEKLEEFKALNESNDADDFLEVIEEWYSPEEN